MLFLSRRGFIGATAMAGLLPASAMSLSSFSAVPLRERLQAAEPGSGFEMEDHHVWGGSVIKASGTYHMFASRWPKWTTFTHGYMQNSEIVRATAANPAGPYTFQEVVMGRRAPGKWDSASAHNPVIYRVGDTYVLFYIGKDYLSFTRKIGIATASSPEGPWQRRDRPLDLGLDTDANNPAAFFEPDGGVKLVWRDRRLRTYISTASSFYGPYTVANDNVWPDARIEDFFFFKRDGTYMILCEDNRGKITGHTKWGTLLYSADGVTNWRVSSPVTAYDHEVRFTNGQNFHPSRRERPWLHIEDNRATHLFTAVWDGEKSWNQPVPIDPPYRVD